MNRINSRQKRRMLLAGAAAGALLLSACGASTGGDSAGGPLSFIKKEPEVTIQDAAYPSAGVEVAGLRPQRVVSSVGAAARWDVLPGSNDFNRAVSATIREQLQAQAQSRGTEYYPEAHAVEAHLNERGCVPGSSFLPAGEILADPALAPNSDGEVLAVVCDPVLASGSNFGERLRFVRGTAEGVSSDTVQTIYTNIETGEVSREADLLAAETLPTLYGEAAKLSASAVGMSADNFLPAEEGAELLRSHTSAIQFSGDGNVLVTVDAGFLAAQLANVQAVTEAAQSGGAEESTEAEEPSEAQPLDLPDPTAFSLSIPPELVDTYLSPLGQSIATSQKEGEAWVGTPDTPLGEDYVDCALNACLALTFDDGPSYLTPGLLEALGSYQIPATFFMVGSMVVESPEIVGQIVQGGHQVGNHSYTHPALTTLSLEAASAELTETSQAIAAAGGVEPTIIRPPYGDWNESVLETAGQPFIMWSIDTLDWQHPGDAALIQSVVYESVPNDIVLMHDIHESTTSVVPQMLPLLLDRGFTMVTIDQLYGGDITGPQVVFGGLS